MAGHEITIVFGEGAVNAYEDGCKRKDRLRDAGGSVETFSFDTEAELDAFMKGIEAGDGWLAHCIYRTAAEERNA